MSSFLGERLALQRTGCMWGLTSWLSGWGGSIFMAFRKRGVKTHFSGFTDASDGSFECIRGWLTGFPPAVERSISVPLTCQDFLLMRWSVCLTPRLLSFSSLTCFICLQEADACQHCGGSGCAPCSLCHGSKLSMLANRFNESISDLRCQACYPHGLEKCQSCSSKQHRLADSRGPQRGSQWTTARHCVWRSARQNCLGPGFALIQNVPGEVFLELEPSLERGIARAHMENLEIQLECAANLADTKTKNAMSLLLAH